MPSKRDTKKWLSLPQTGMRKSVRIDDSYQVKQLPSIEEKDSSSRDSLYDKIWDPSEAKLSGTMDVIHLTVPHNKKGIAMIDLHKRNYSLAGFYESLGKACPEDGSDWSMGEKKAFHEAMLETRKDMKKIAYKTKKSMNACLSYYYSTYKLSDEYRLLKAIMEDERKISTHEQVCFVCKEGNNLIYCGGNCGKACHPQCHDILLPGKVWLCDECLIIKAEKAKDELLSKVTNNSNSSIHAKTRKFAAAVSEIFGKSDSSSDK